MFSDSLVRKHGWPKLILAMLDVLAVLLAALLTFYVRYYGEPELYDLKNSLWEYASRIVILAASFPILIVLFRQNLLYKYKVYASGASQFALILRGVLLNALLLIAVFFFVREEYIQHSRANLLLFSLSAIVFLSFLRILVFRKWILPKVLGKRSRRVLLVGSGETARTLIDVPEGKAGLPFEFIAVVDAKIALPEMQLNGRHVPVLSQFPKGLKDFARVHDLHEVIVAEDDLPYEQAIDVIAECRTAGVYVNLLSDHFKVIHERVTKSNSEYLNVATAPVSFGLEGPYAQYLKRPGDILGSLLALVLLSPILAGIALAVKLTSKGPLFFATKVVGQHGQYFIWHKFRTMRTDMAADIHRQHVAEHIRLGTRPTGKLENDPRITPVGRFLRKHSLDELPQLWSVLRGDMSLVGPRPCLPYEYDEYQEWHKERFEVRPGITGLWQVSGRSSVSFNDMVVLDLYYIHNLSLWLDAAIIIRTIGVVLTGRGGG